MLQLSSFTLTLWRTVSIAVAEASIIGFAAGYVAGSALATIPELVVVRSGRAGWRVAKGLPWAGSTTLGMLRDVAGAALVATPRSVAVCSGRAGWRLGKGVARAGSTMLRALASPLRAFRLGRR